MIHHLDSRFYAICAQYQISLAPTEEIKRHAFNVGMSAGHVTVATVNALNMDSRAEYYGRHTPQHFEIACKMEAARFSRNQYHIEVCRRVADGLRADAIAGASLARSADAQEDALHGEATGGISCIIAPHYFAGPMTSATALSSREDITSVGPARNDDLRDTFAVGEAWAARIFNADPPTEQGSFLSSIPRRALRRVRSGLPSAGHSDQCAGAESAHTASGHQLRPKRSWHRSRIKAISAKSHYTEI